QLENKKILILERHFQVGGFTHTFQRKRKYEWDVGLHYVGQLGEDGDLKKAFDFLTRGQLKWAEMPDVFDKFVYPDFTFEVRKGRNNFRNDLIKTFPHEEKAIRQYFYDLDRVNTWFKINETKKNVPDFIRPLFNLLPDEKDFALQTVAEYMNKSFEDERLKAILVSQWGDYGIPPAKAAFAIHCILVSHYFKGAFYPVGGSGQIAETMLPIIQEKGGHILLNHRVDEILIESGKAVGVRAEYLRAGEEEEPIKEFRAPLIISGAGAYITYERLLKNYEDNPYREGLRSFDTKNQTTAHISMYLGLKDSPAKLGFGGENHWIFSSLDHDASFAGRNSWIHKDGPLMCYLSFPSLKDPQAKAHTAELITFVDYEAFSKWQDTKWTKRGEDYKLLKEKIAEGMISFIEKHYPGFRDLIEYQELSTPLTTVSMTGHHRATIYGLAGTPDRFDNEKSPWCQARTPIKGLYLTGSEASAWGIAGAMLSGYVTATHLLQPWNMPKILSLLAHSPPIKEDGKDNPAEGIDNFNKIKKESTAPIVKEEKQLEGVS
ncbi:MAG: NAD(P)/FAD-dependent oxidoreductase, partial [Spirochaetota bacterium]